MAGLQQQGVAKEANFLQALTNLVDRSCERPERHEHVWRLLAWAHDGPRSATNTPDVAHRQNVPDVLRFHAFLHPEVLRVHGEQRLSLGGAMRMC